jgi:hypothetical protein
MREEILDSIAAHALDREELADDEGKRKKYIKRYRQLLDNPKTRDAELWTNAFKNLGLDVEKWGGLTPKQLNQFKVSQRGITWRLVNKTLFAVAQIEAFMDVYLDELISIGEDHNKQLHVKTKKLSQKEARSIAQEGIKLRLKNERENRKKKRGVNVTVESTST